MPEINTHENDHDLLIRIDTKLGILLTQFNEHKEIAVKEIAVLKENKLNKEDFTTYKKGQEKVDSDIEDRVRKLERYGAIAVGAIAVLQVVIGLIK